MVDIQRIGGGDVTCRDGLRDLLIDTVNSGGSVGFLAPMQRSTAAAYWDGVFSSLGSGLVLWVAQGEGHVAGSVQLSLCQKENGLHRAEVQKLLVLSAFRGRGIASRLMSEVESFARQQGRSLLVLDTEVGSHAETVYRHLNWRRAGEIPRYAKCPDGTWHATAYHYKELADCGD